LTPLCRIRQGIFDRWYIFHPTNDSMAWSGSHWVGCCFNGLPYNVQVCNFDSEDQALEYCQKGNLTPVEK